MRTRLTIEWKILSGMGILMLGYLCSVGYNFVQEAGSEAALRHISGSDFPQAIQSGQASFEFEAAVKLFQDATTLGDGEMLEEAKRRAQAAESLLSAMASRTEPASEDRAALEARAEKIVNYAEAASEIYARMNGGGDVDFAALQSRAQQLSRLSEDIKDGLRSDGERFEKHLEDSLAEVEGETRFRRWMSVWICLAVTVVSGVAVMVVIRRAVTRPINEIVKRLKKASGSVTSGSQSISGVQQSLAEETSRQAATLEQFSSSLEELTSMTQGNADSAKKANSVMEETSGRVKDASKAIKQLQLSMSEIATASSETQKIVKTIDEIAFQTNILALNAAVEAARAGEAGSGFAVVADEVRSLAQRAAQSARSTAALIDGSAEKIEQGTRTAEDTNGVFVALEKGYTEIQKLINSISQASVEQAEGLMQINQGVSSMDTAVQQSAASAQQSASSAKEMNRQAREMDQIVEDLFHLIGNGGKEPGRISQADHQELGIELASDEDDDAFADFKPLVDSRAVPKRRGVVARRS